MNGQHKIASMIFGSELLNKTKRNLFQSHAAKYKMDGNQQHKLYASNSLDGAVGYCFRFIRNPPFLGLSGWGIQPKSPILSISSRPIKHIINEGEKKNRVSVFFYNYSAGNPSLALILVL